MHSKRNKRRPVNNGCAFISYPDLRLSGAELKSILKKQFAYLTGM